MLNHVSGWQVGTWLDGLATGPSFAALAFAEPTEADPFSVEVTGNGYRRVQVFWQRRGRAIVNDNVLKFSGLEVPVGLVAVMIFTAMFRGDMRASGVLSQPMTLIDTPGVTFGKGEIVLYVD